MQFKYLAAALLSASAVLASPTQQEKRQDLGDVIGSAIESAATSIFDEATSRAGDFGDSFTSRAGEIGDAVTSRAGDIGADITSLAGEVFSTVTSVGGKAFTVVTSAGGEAITLAEAGAGVVTSKFGSVYTVATAAVASEIANNEDDTGSASTFQVQTTLVVGAATVLGSALLGAFMTL
ncbi:hypothetical protein CC1G_13629 [Coprinopsis cinerea okayama7|uniref:Uncharacterized protein n=1 Tax=Coprinopsis cinerea (strain Okayama-7 / 130 / ATCC MYA-4618 / FGSC 9003) TaxID=240176 RepID=D6RK07_COPC7|nr:hypothetical protein CC1G_13629 [Coprinopsis cinerea okayama7\|eukprot:XP_021122203.1 hypothetical protein CC1G_13629 [Coprinopsis cinerea okayama7\